MFNISALKRTHSKAIQEQVKVFDGATSQILREAVRLAQGQNAIRDRSGKLRSGWLWKMRKTQDGATGTLYNAVPYAIYQEKGTGKYGPKGAPYRITARRAKMLRFRNGSGDLVFRHSVMHPGVKPQRIGRAALFGHAAPFSGVDMTNSIRIFGRWMTQAARRF